MAYITSTSDRRITVVQRRPLISLHVSADGSCRSDSSQQIDRRRRLWTAFDRLPPSLLVGRSTDGHPRLGDTRGTGRWLCVVIVFFNLEHGAIDDVPARYHTATVRPDNTDVFRYRPRHIGRSAINNNHLLATPIESCYTDSQTLPAGMSIHISWKIKVFLCCLTQRFVWACASKCCCQLY